MFGKHKRTKDLRNVRCFAVSSTTQLWFLVQTEIISPDLFITSMCSDGNDIITLSFMLTLLLNSGFLPNTCVVFI